MAFASVGNGGTGVSSTSGTTLNVNAARDITGTTQFAILVVSCDNTTTTDSTSNDVLSVSNADGGTWTKLAEYTNGNGAAAAGVTTAVFRYIPGTGEIRNGDPATITFASARVHKAASMWVFTRAANLPVSLGAAPIANGVDGVAGFGSVAFSGLSNIARLYIRGLGKEAQTTTQITPTTSFTAMTQANSAAVAAAIATRGEFRIFTGTGLTSNPTLATTGDTAGIFLALVEGVAQTLNQGTRFNNAQTFYAATLTQGAGDQTLTQNARFNEVIDFYAATVTTGPVNLTQNARFDEVNDFYAATITQGGANQTLTQTARFDEVIDFYAASISQTGANQTLTQNARFDELIEFYPATVTVGPVTLTQNARFDEAVDFYAATVTRGPVNLTQNARFGNLTTFYPAMIAIGATTLTQTARFNEGIDFYAATVTTGPFGLVQNARFDNGNTFYAATVTRGAVNLSPTRFDNAVTFYPATISIGATNLTQTARFNEVIDFYPASISLGAFGLVQNTRFNLATAFYSATLAQGPGPAQTLNQNARFNSTTTFFPAVIGDGSQQPILGVGGVTRPPRRFKPSILWEFDKVEPDASASATLAGLSLSVGVGAVVASSPDPIDARASLTYTQIEAYMQPTIRAKSSWNDPTDEELAFILDFALD
jgi:hypothetical protein